MIKDARRFEREVAKKGLKIKDLARDLGVTSRQVIDRCREGGVPAQNSITKLSAEQEQRVRGWFNKSDESTAGLAAP